MVYMISDFLKKTLCHSNLSGEELDFKELGAR